MITDREKMELINLRKRVVRQRDEIIMLQEKIKKLEEGRETRDPSGQDDSDRSEGLGGWGR